jgi:hypothetical protein
LQKLFSALVILPDTKQPATSDRLHVSGGWFNSTVHSPIGYLAEVAESRAVPGTHKAPLDMAARFMIQVDYLFRLVKLVIRFELPHIL